MDVREKLVELIKEIYYDKKLCWYDLWDMRDGAEDIADLLIARGVTVDEWVSVKDRLPEESGYYLVFADIGRSEVLSYSKKYKAFNAFDDSYSESNVIPVTHWMPLPNPPKGE